MARNYQTGLIITGDATGAIQATRLTEGALARLNNRTTESSSAWDRVRNSIAQNNSVMQAATRTMSIFMAAFSAERLISYSDQWTNMSSRLSLVTDSTSQLVREQNKLFSIAQNTRSILPGVTDLYFKMAQATTQLGLSQQVLNDRTSTVSKAIALSGANQGQSNAATLQLGQGLASNRLGGDEYKSLSENAPRIIKAIADGMNVSIGKLRELSTQGELTAKVILDALGNSANKIDAEFKKMQPTISQSFTLIQNEIQKYIGTAGQANGISAGVANGLKSVADNFDFLARAVGVAAIASLPTVLLSIATGLKAITAAAMANPLGAAVTVAAGAIGVIIERVDYLKQQKVDKMMPATTLQDQDKKIAAQAEIITKLANEKNIFGKMPLHAQSQLDKELVTMKYMLSMRDDMLQVMDEEAEKQKKQQALAAQNNIGTQKEIDLQEKLKSIMEGRYKQQIIAAAQRNNVDQNFMLAVAQQETSSKGTFDTVSSSGARGLMQIMPDTAAGLAKQMHVAYDKIYSDLDTHLNASAYLIKQNMAFLEKNGKLTVENLAAMYNASPSSLKKYDFNKVNFPASDKDNSLYKQTIPYMENVAAMSSALNKMSGTDPFKVQDKSLKKLQEDNYKYATDGVKLAESLITPTQQYEKTIAELRTRLQEGYINQQQFNLGLSIAKDTVQKAVESTSEYINSQAELKLVTEANSAVADTFYAKQMKDLNYTNDEISREIELQHKLAAAIAANPGVNPDIVRNSILQKNAAEVQLQSIINSQKATATYENELQNLNKANLEIIGSNKIIYDQGLKELQQKGLLTQAEHDHLLKIYETNQALKMQRDLYGTLISSATSAFTSIVDGSKSFAQAMTSIFDSMISNIQNKLVDLATNNIMSKNWSGFFSNILGIAATYIPKLFSANNNTTPSAATTVQNKNLFGTGAMAIADTSSRSFYQSATIDSVRSFNNSVDFMSTAIRQNASKLSDVVINYAGKLATQLFSTSSFNGLAFIKNGVTAIYSDITAFGSKLMGGWNSMVSEAATFITELTGTAATQLSTTVSSSWSAGIAQSQTSFAGATQASAASSATEAAGSSALGQAAGALGIVYSIAKLGMDLFEIAGNKYTTTTMKVSAAFDSASMAALGVTAGITALLGAIPIVGWIAAAVLNVASSVASMLDHGVNWDNLSQLFGGHLAVLLNDAFGFVTLPSATMLTDSLNLNKAQYGIEQTDKGYFTNTANQSASVGVDTAFGTLEIRLNDFNTNTQMVIDGFLPLLNTIQSFDRALGASLTIVDGTGQTLQQFNAIVKRTEYEKNLSNLDTGSMVTERFGNIGTTLQQTNTLAGQVAGTWITAFYQKMMRPGDGQYNQLQTFNIETMIAASLPELVKLPLKLADLFVQSVKSVADGATQEQFQAQTNDFFTGWSIAEQGLKKANIDINQTAIPEYLTSLTGIGLTVKDSAVALVSFAQTFKSAGVGASTAFNETFTNIIKQAKDKGFANEQTSGYFSSYSTLGGIASNLGIKSSNTELNSLSLSLNDIAVKSTQAANDVIDHAIADNKLSNLTRSAAIEQLNLAGKIDDATIASASYGKALTDAQTVMFSGIEFANQQAIMFKVALGDVGFSMSQLANIGSSLTSTFGDLSKAQNFLDSVLQQSMGDSAFYSGKMSQAQASFDSASKSLGLAGLTVDQFAKYAASGVYSKYLVAAAGNKDSAMLNNLNTLGNSYLTLTTAQSSYKNAISSTTNALTDMQTSINEYINDLLTTSIGTPEQQVNAAMQIGYADYQKALAGDSTAMGNIVNDAKTIISAAESAYGSGDKAISIRNTVMDALQSLKGGNLSYLPGKIGTIDTSGTAPPVVASGTNTSGIQVTVNNADLMAKIDLLTEELKQLRADQQAAAAGIINAETSGTVQIVTSINNVTKATQTAAAKAELA